MVKEGRAQYADPCSMIRAAAMLVNHIGFPERSRKLQMALDICGQYEKKLVITGRSNGATGKDYADYLMETMQLPDLEEKWNSYQ
jgi:isocitrate dehydrogenase (NAD+)